MSDLKWKSGIYSEETGNYLGHDKVYNPTLDKFERPQVSDIITAAAKYGFTPLLITGQRCIRFFKCPDCGSLLMFRLIKKPDMRNNVRACKDCGHRSMTPGMEKNHGNFVLV